MSLHATRSGPDERSVGRMQSTVSQYTVARDIDNDGLCVGHGHQRKQAGLGTQIC